MLLCSFRGIARPRGGQTTRTTSISPKRPATSVLIPLVQNGFAEDAAHNPAPNPPVAAYIGFALSGRKARNRRIFHRPVQESANRIKAFPFFRPSKLSDELRAFPSLSAVSFSPLAPVRAQIALPGAAPAAPAGAGRPPRPSRRSQPRNAKAAKSKPLAAPGVETIDGRPLMLNGRTGLLQVSGSGKTLEVDKLRLPGESVSDPSQRCIVDIVGEKPIEATSEGRPDGLDRYDVDVPACPFTFDVLDGAVLVPSQITACVFKAADCQTSPGGLWGPDGAELEKDAAAIGKRRNEAEKAMAKAVHAIEERAKDNPDAADLLRDQNAFPGQRDDACRDYVKESAHGFCAASLTEARAAFLEARLAALSPPAAKESNSATKAEKKAHKPKTGELPQ